MHTHTLSKAPNPEAKKKSGTTPFFQAKLTVNTPGDAHEQEADQVADQVMRMKEDEEPVVQRMPLTPVNSVQRMCAECEEEQGGKVQRQETASSSASGQTAPPVVSQVLSSGSGSPMDKGTRQFMEQRFGQDFGQVRIHTGGQAAESATAIQAKAYTSGKDIVFGAGEYRPESGEGRRLLAHELVHVGQQQSVAEQKIQREVDPVFSLHYRLTLGSDRRHDRHDVYAGGPNIPLLGHPALGLRIVDGGVEPIAGRNPMELGSEMYSPGDVRGLLRGRGNSSTQTTCPVERISPVGCCPIGQSWNRERFRCESPTLPNFFFDRAMQPRLLQPNPPFSPSLQFPNFQQQRQNRFHLIDPSLLQLNLGQTEQPENQTTQVTNISDAGVNFIGRFEGLRLQKYNDAAGHCTIGYGHLVHRGACVDVDYPNGITQEQALELLRTDAATAVAAVNRQITVPLSQTQFDALVSFVYNLGEGSFQSSTLRTRINNNSTNEQIRAEFLRWNRAGGRVLAGLTDRRTSEADLFINGTYCK